MTARTADLTAGAWTHHGSSGATVLSLPQRSAADRACEAALTRTQSLHGRFPGAPPLRLKAVQLIHDNIACICAWCADKTEADSWCRTQGYETTHSICPACQEELAARISLPSCTG